MPISRIAPLARSSETSRPLGLRCGARMPRDGHSGAFGVCFSALMGDSCSPTPIVIQHGKKWGNPDSSQEFGPSAFIAWLQAASQSDQQGSHLKFSVLRHACPFFMFFCLFSKSKVVLPLIFKKLLVHQPKSTVLPLHEAGVPWNTQKVGFELTIGKSNR